jgi:transposase-like protein
MTASHDVLTEICRQGAREMTARAIEAAVAEWIEARAHLRDESGRRQVVRNGAHPERTILTGLGAIVKQPRVLDRRPGAAKEVFRPSVLPPSLRRTKSIDALIPRLYLQGVGTDDFPEALQVILGVDAKGLSANTLTRLEAAWEAEHEAWRKRSLKGKHYVYVWSGPTASISTFAGRTTASASWCSWTLPPTARRS